MADSWPFVKDQQAAHPCKGVVETVIGSVGRTQGELRGKFAIGCHHKIGLQMCRIQGFKRLSEKKALRLVDPVARFSSRK